MNKLTLSLILLSFSSALVTHSSVADDLNQLDDKAQITQQKESKINQERLERSASEKASQQEIYDELAAKLATIKSKNDALSQAFTENEAKLAKKNQALELESGSLGEVFAVARKAAKDAHDAYQSSYLDQDALAFDKHLTQLLDTQSMPSMEDLNVLWQAVDYKARSASEAVQIELPFIQGDGAKQPQTMIRLGDIALVGEKGLLTWDFDRQQAAQYLTQPTNAANMTAVKAEQSLLLDPTRGELLSQYANKPTLMQRFEQSGAVGKVIIALLIIGLCIAIARGFVLSKTQAQIKSQLKKPENIGNNPLGRILNVYDKEKSQSVNSLELRLLETILDEQHGLEKGLSMLKLLAALAPMLGLLGTVTGMIQTFQVITEFGNGDPKVMAGGISMALSTTVLGLVAAIPLLLAHNLLSNRAEAIRGILEKQGVSLVAQRAETSEDQVTQSGMQPAGA